MAGVDSANAASTRTAPGPSVTRAIWLLAAGLGVAYSALALFNHFMFRTTGFDLGIFDQAVRAWASFRLPTSDLKSPGFALLGDHFHPILALLAPLYWIFPSAMTLLVAQALLFAVSVVPVTGLAIERLGRRPGLMIGAAYGLSWGIQQAVWFDFHEIAFGVPLLAFSMVALARRQWLPAALWALPLLLVKEDMGLTVGAVAAYIFLVGRRRWLGTALAATAVAVGLLAILVVIPHLNPDGVYPYFGISLGDDAPSNPLVRLFTPGIKGETLFYLLLPTVFLACRSPLALIAVPTLLWRFWATNTAYWGTDFHYSAVLMPIIFVAMIDGLARLLDDAPALLARARLTPGRATHGVALIALVIALVSTGAVAHDRRDVTEEWEPISQAQAEHEALEIIPDGATVSAANALAPQLTDRATVYLFPDQTDPGEQPRAEWVVVSDLYSWPLTRPEYAEEKAEIAGNGYEVVTTVGDLVIYRQQTEE